MKDQVRNPVDLVDSSLWILSTGRQLAYSDGLVAERRLTSLLTQASDLSSTSPDLGKHTQHWPILYHLSPLRSNLLRGFTFDRNCRVLEVGCGCGAITRYLGETFREVVAVEGSLERARIAQLRTRDLASVSILCAPLQDIEFVEPFDLVVCVGVFEYASVYVDDGDSHDLLLQYLHRVLTPDGALIIAIENQFGLKYFASSPEDHTNMMFDGLEGYPRCRHGVRTFGRTELERRVRTYFDHVEFYYPYPDYKMAQCVVSEELFNTVRAGELIGSFESISLGREVTSLFDERLVLLELERNGQMPWFSNSFLVVAAKQLQVVVKFPHLGVLFNTQRVAALQTQTFITKRRDGAVVVRKQPLAGGSKVVIGELVLQATESEWVHGPSLNTELLRRVKERALSLEEVFAPCAIWMQELRSLATRQGGREYLDGECVDHIWRNSYLQGDRVIFVDREWKWGERIPLNVLVIRSVHRFLADIRGMRDVNPQIAAGQMKRVIVRLAKGLGVELSQEDFKEFYGLEARLAHLILGESETRARMRLKLTVEHRDLLRMVSRLNRLQTRSRRALERLVQYVGG